MKTIPSLISALSLILMAASRLCLAAETNTWVTLFDERFVDNPQQRFHMVPVPIPGTTSFGASTHYDEERNAYSVAGHLSLVRPVRAGAQVRLPNAQVRGAGHKRTVRDDHGFQARPLRPHHGRR